MDAETMLWYTEPAADFDHALPIGNGRIGAMVFGGAADEVLKLNEDSVWSGGKRNRNNPDAREGLEEETVLFFGVVEAVLFFWTAEIGLLRDDIYFE